MDWHVETQAAPGGDQDRQLIRIFVAPGDRHKQFRDMMVQRPSSYFLGCGKQLHLIDSLIWGLIGGYTREKVWWYVLPEKLNDAAAILHALGRQDWLERHRAALEPHKPRTEPLQGQLEAANRYAAELRDENDTLHQKLDLAKRELDRAVEENDRINKKAYIFRANASDELKTSIQRLQRMKIGEQRADFNIWPRSCLDSRFARRLPLWSRWAASLSSVRRRTQRSRLLWRRRWGR